MIPWVKNKVKLLRGQVRKPTDMVEYIGLGVPGLLRPEALPGYVSLCFILTEDEQFLSHRGINWRAFWHRQFLTLTRQSGSGAGSSITEQVMRYAFFSPWTRYRTKVQKMLLAREAEKKFSKDEILCLYLSNAKLARQIRGLSKGADYYFGKIPGQLSVVEALFLAYAIRYPTSVDEACLKKLYFHKFNNFLRIKLFEVFFFYVSTIGIESLLRFEHYGYSEIKVGLLKYMGRKTYKRYPMHVYREVEWLVLDQLQEFKAWFLSFEKPLNTKAVA